MKISFKHIAIFAVLFTTLFGQNPDRKNMAIYNFSGLGVSPIEAQVLSDRIRVELSKLGTYNIIERGLMEQILKEQVLQLSGLCDDASCLVEVGRILAVHYIVGGSVSKLGDLFTIEARIIDVESGEIVTNVVEDYNGPIENLLVQTTRIVAAKLCGIDAGQSTFALTGTCDLLVESNPAGGTIYINDKPMGDVTPYTIEGLREGKYTIKVRKGDLVGEATTSLGRDERKEVNVILAKQQFIMRINSVPEGTNVTINHANIGATPVDYSFTDTTVDYQVQLQKDLYLNIDESVHFVEGAMLRLNYRLEPCGRIEIPYQDDIEVFLNDEYLNQISNTVIAGSASSNSKRWVIDQLGFSDYRIRIEKVHYQTFEKNVSLTLEQPLKPIDYELTLENAITVFESNLSTSAKITSEQPVFEQTFELSAMNRTKLSLPYGSYSFFATAPGYLGIESELELFSQNPDPIAIHFLRPDKTLALKRSLLFPGMGQIYSRQKEKGVAFSFITCAGVGWLIKSLLNYNEELSRYNILEDSYRGAVIVEDRDSFHKQVNASRDLLQGHQNQFLAASALISITYTWNIVDILRLKYNE